MSGLTNLYDLAPEPLMAAMADLGEPPYRARQVWAWLYKRFADDIGEMTDLPASLRQKMSERYTVGTAVIVASQVSTDGQTRKILSRLEDGQLIETVLMSYEKRRTLCVSTQAGCAMGCVFCATGQMGFVRHLSVAEILLPIMYFARELSRQGESISNIVMMGMGEPLHNYDNTLAALDRLTDENGFNLGDRRITISTVGLVPAIRRYADERRPSPLAVSLHAATDSERDKLIPINRRWPIKTLMEACRYYVNRSGRRITFEWALIDGENDTPDQARALGKLVQGMLCHVNLIPLNPTGGFRGGPSSRTRVDRFQAELGRYGVSSTVRVRRGIDIQAGCGQLRDRVLRE